MPPSCRRRPFALLLVVLLASPLGGCGTLTVAQERQLGRQLEQDVRREFVLLGDRVVTGYVRGIGADILAAAGPQPFDYEFTVIDDGEINAFAAPAGGIYVNTGTILKARNVSELAGVIGHEIGHVAHRHVAANYNRQRNTSIAYQVVAVLAGIFGGGAAYNAAQLGGGLAAMALLNSFGREAEREADAFAVQTLPRAGYDPNGLVTFFETLARESGPRPPSFLSSHPATEDRIAATLEGIAALPPTAGLRSGDGGKLEIIQRRIELLTRPAPTPL